MSHAAVIVAVDVVDPSNREEIEAAVCFQMEPYDENGEWFKDGSRWDWYQIGGRYTGLLSDYEPREDPRNIVLCEFCGGTGIRPDGREQFGQEWFDACHGCNGCHGTGKKLAWEFVPFEGDIIQVKRLPMVKVSSAFLRNRHWHEYGRLGWFGCMAPTECEINNPNDPNTLTRKCATTGDENAKIVVWNEPWEIWGEHFTHRFIEPLPPDAVLVVVDYHV